MAKIFAALAVSVPQTRIGTRLIDMPGAAQAQEGDDEIDRAHRGGDAEQDHAQRIHVDIGTGIVGARGIGHVIEPAVIGAEAESEGGVKENARAEIDPIGQRVQPRQRHVARAQQQRPEIIAEKPDSTGPA